MRSVSFLAWGDLATKGSMRAFTQPAKYVGERPRAILAPDNKRCRPWMDLVYWAANEAWGNDPTRKPVRVDLTFYLQRPKGHFGTGRNAGIVKGSAPAVPDKKPDKDKLERAVLDALTGAVYIDDCQVVTGTTTKAYVTNGKTGVLIQVQELPATVDEANAEMDDADN